jgi:hypothetical protein
MDFELICLEVDSAISDLHGKDRLQQYRYDAIRYWDNLLPTGYRLLESGGLSEPQKRDLKNRLSVLWQQVATHVLHSNEAEVPLQRRIRRQAVIIAFEALGLADPEYDPVQYLAALLRFTNIYGQCFGNTRALRYLIGGWKRLVDTRKDDAGFMKYARWRVKRRMTRYLPCETSLRMVAAIRGDVQNYTLPTPVTEEQGSYDEAEVQKAICDMLSERFRVAELCFKEDVHTCDLYRATLVLENCVRVFKINGRPLHALTAERKLCKILLIDPSETAYLTDQICSLTEQADADHIGIESFKAAKLLDVQDILEPMLFHERMRYCGMMLKSNYL